MENMSELQAILARAGVTGLRPVKPAAAGDPRLDVVPADLSEERKAYWQRVQAVRGRMVEEGGRLRLPGDLLPVAAPPLAPLSRPMLRQLAIHPETVTAAGLPERVAGRRLDGVKREALPALVEYLAHLPEAERDGVGVFLQGLRRTGKTTALGLIAEAWRRGDRPRWVRYLVQVDLCRHCNAGEKARLHPDWQSLDNTLRRCAVLLVDEFSVVDLNDWGGRAYWFSLWDHRTSNGLVTCVASNVSRETLEADAQAAGDEDMLRVLARLRECCQPITLPGGEAGRPLPDYWWERE